MPIDIVKKNYIENATEAQAQDDLLWLDQEAKSAEAQKAIEEKPKEEGPSVVDRLMQPLLNVLPQVSRQFHESMA